MVWENQIHPPAMNIECLTQIFDRHGRTLDVPAGTPWTPRALPRWLARLALFPKSKIHRRSLALIDVHSSPSLEILKLAFRELSISGIFGHFKIHVSIDLIGQALLHQGLGQTNNIGHVFCGLRLYGSLANAQALHVFVVGLNIFCGERLAADTLLVCTFDDLVIHVGEVLDEFNLVAGGLKIPSDHIEHERAARMADMAIVVDRHATDVHPNDLRLERVKRFFLPRE